MIKDLEFYHFNYVPGTVNSGTLDLGTLSNNVGADNTLVFSGPLPGLAGGVLHIVLSTPYTYDPANGNLLMDLFSSGGSGGGVFMDARNGTAGGLFSRAMTPGCCSGDSDWGLVTGFSTGVPEPSTWALMLLGFAGLGAAGYRASRKSTVVAA